MSITHYEGKLIPIKNNNPFFKNFGDKRIQKNIFDILKELKDGSATLFRSEDGEMWITAEEIWLRISPKGEIEIGEPSP